MTTPGIDEEKRQRIIRASVDEFRKGYALASTNEIVRKAGVSKGLLFHYFGNKKNLFLEAFKECATEFRAKIFEALDAGPNQMSGDIFERLTELALIKLELYRDNIALGQFLIGAIQDSPDDTRPELQTLIETAVEDGLTRLLIGIDLSTLRPDVDPAKAIKLIQLVMDGLLQDYIGRKDFTSLDWDKEVAEFTEYMDMLRKGLGKQES